MQSKQDKKALINEVQNLIYALGFEKWVEPKSRLDNAPDAYTIFALAEKFISSNSSWKSIKVNHNGPTTPEMKAVLLAARDALVESNSELLSEAKQKNSGYDKVQTLTSGMQSNSSTIGFFSDNLIGYSTNQPGNLVDNIVTKIDNYFKAVAASKMQNTNESTDFKL